jgi:nucleoside-diphosphate-sugar epimerase
LEEVILITGITGFLGSHLGKLLIENNYQVIATRRTVSNLKNCVEYQEQIEWINIDEDNWKEQIIALQPKTILHVAWIGVSAIDRDDWKQQSKNLFFLQDVLYIAKQSDTQKIIGLGSQAEYGFIDAVVSEPHPLKPTTAYGAVKIISSQLLKNFCVDHNIKWYWLRVFSVFGEKEGTGSLLPDVIQTIAAKQVKKMAFTPGEQQYAYLYIKDFINAIKKVIVNQNNSCGVYNISSTQPTSLKMITTFIRDIIDPDFILEFGSLPYRQNQSMLIAGDVTLFNKVFGCLEETNFEEGIKNTINYYTSKSLNESV